MNNTDVIEVSVVMPVYNGEKYLREAIDSILNQSFRDFEFIIVNDGSTDQSVEIIQSYKDSRIKLINQVNGGVSNALNTGLKNAVGKYVVRMDADDISHHNRIEIQYNFIKNNPEYVIVGSDVNYVTEENDFIFRYFSPAYSNEEITKLISTHCTFIHTAVIFNREVILEEGYREEAYAFEDHFLWAKIIKNNNGRVCNLKEVLVDVRLNAASVTVDFNDYDPIYLKTKLEVIQSGNISPDSGELLRTSFKKLDQKLKTISYHRLLAKKYLWNNYQPKKARQNLKKAFSLSPFDKTTIGLFVLSFLPQRVIQKIYSFKK